MKSSDYWRKREEKWIKQQIKEDAKQSKIIAEKYQKALDQIEKEISANWERFAGKEGVTLSDAKKMALEMDVKAFARKAKEYVDTKDFSKTANDELRLYNVTMRTNRLELLKSQIGLELIALSDEVDKYTAETLTKTGLKEAERQAGILGETVFSNYKTFVESVAFGSFQGATFSERIWGNNGALKADLDRLLIRSVTQGRNPRELARELRTLFDSSKYEAERLMRTETARMQISIQQKSYLENDIDEFEFVAEPSACGLCRPLDGKTFKVSKMEPGLNAAPIHPNCRCSTVPSVDREVLERRLAEIDKANEKAYNKDDELASVLNVKRGEPMTIREADDSNANPRYKEGKNYQINCQRCVPAYELRRRGFNVEALSAADGSIWENGNSMVVFYGSRGMRIPKTFINPESKEYELSTLIGKRTMKQAYKKLEETVKNDERYFLAMEWAQGGAHIVNMEKIDGVLSIVDSQSGEILPIDKYFSYYKAKPSSLNYCRIDNLDLNLDLIKKLVKTKDGGEQK